MIYLLNKHAIANGGGGGGRPGKAGGIGRPPSAPYGNHDAIGNGLTGGGTGGAGANCGWSANLKWLKENFV